LKSSPDAVFGIHNEAGSRPRINADDLERIVIETLREEQTKDGSGNAETQAAGPPLALPQRGEGKIELAYDA
jgi:hypothetical protein